MKEKPDEDVVVVIVCAPVERVDVVPAAAGSQIMSCDTCNEKIWVAATSRRFKAEEHPTAQLVCQKCGWLMTMEYRANHPDEEMLIDAVPGSSREFVHHVRNFLHAEDN